MSDHAQVINFSESEITVAGSLNGGQLSQWTLKPGRQTKKNLFRVEALKGFEPSFISFSDSVSIFGSYHWWTVKPDVGLRVFVHDLRKKNDKITLSLHRIPLTINDEPTARIGDSNDQNKYDALNDGNGDFDQAANPPRQSTDRDTDGKIMIEALGDPPLLMVWHHFGYVRSGNDVLVRIQLADSRPPQTGTPIKELQDRWSQLIVDRWAPLGDFAIDWDTTADFVHQVVEVRPKPATRVRWNSKEWYDEIQDGVVEHEFGHLIGFIDEYLYEQELPYFALQEGYKPPAEWPDNVLTAIKTYPLGQERVTVRKESAASCVNYEPSIMNRPESLNVTWALKNAFDQGTRQSLCYNRKLFCHALTDYVPLWPPATGC
jgi:hypothetical protein